MELGCTILVTLFSFALNMLVQRPSQQVWSVAASYKSRLGPQCSEQDRYSKG